MPVSAPSTKYITGRAGGGGCCSRGPITAKSCPRTRVDAAPFCLKSHLRCSRTDTLSAETNLSIESMSDEAGLSSAAAGLLSERMLSVTADLSAEDLSSKTVLSSEMLPV